jgi:hypothetical protein
MSVLSINNLDVAADFPSAAYEAVCAKTSGYSKHPAHPMLIGALYAVSYRFNALAEYGDKLVDSIKLHGAGPGNPQRYEQERDLFGFFSNGFSALESFAFGMFAVGAIKVGSPNFPLITEDDESNVRWSTLLRAYAKAFPDDPVNSALEAFWKDQGLRDFNSDRNILTHRAAPPSTTLADFERPGIPKSVFQ